MVAGTEYEALVMFVRTAQLDALIQRLMRSGLLRNNVPCIHCNIEMNLSEDSSRGDGYKWICQNKHCSHSKTTIGLRVGSFFEGFKSDLKDICTVMFCLLLEKPAKTITADFGINKNIITKIFHKLRGVISNYLQSDPVRLGVLVLYARSTNLCFHIKLRPIEEEHQHSKFGCSELLIPALNPVKDIWK